MAEDAAKFLRALEAGFQSGEETGHVLHDFDVADP
jgi:hypothetical protein